MQDILVSAVPPNGFCAEVEIVATYVEVQGRLLFLQRNGSERGFWGVPAGKVEEGEGIEEAMWRELREETGMIPSGKERLDYLGKLFVRKADREYIFHMHHLTLEQEPRIILNDEHQTYGWLLREEREKVPLMSGAREALDYFDRYSTKKKRKGTSLNVYLLLLQNDHLLLHLRRNTGYCDGLYGVVSGHVEDGESALDALVREAYEEAGIRLERKNLRFVYSLHRQSNRSNIDLFFTAHLWEGQIDNREPEKCGDLRFFPLSSLPELTIDYIREVLKEIAAGNSYSEMGWDS